jgi:hypothetical protein
VHFLGRSPPLGIGAKRPLWIEHASWPTSQGRWRLSAEGIVSKKVDSTYRSVQCRVWIKVRNPASVAVQRERSENWNR